MSAKPTILVYGNCQACWLSQYLAAQPDVTARYDVTYLSDFEVIPDDHPTRQPGYFAGCEVAVWQTAPTRTAPPGFLNAVAPHTRQIRFPTLWLKLLWPTHGPDPRAQPEPGFPYGRFPYGDRLVLRLLAQGIAPADIPAHYRATDLNTIVNLDRFAKMTLAELRHGDRQSDVTVTPIIESTLRQEKLFGTVNHPTHRMLAHLGDAVLAQLLDRPQTATPSLRANDVFGTEEVPLHPQVISHFGLNWAPPTRRWRYHSQLLSLDDYLRAYATWEAIPIDEPPQLWLSRAQDAAQHHESADAERILLEAATRFPELPHFLHFLGLIRLRRGAPLEAEQVFRFGLQRHPQHAPFHHQLGVALLQRGFPEPATDSLRTAVSLDPSLHEARQLLRQSINPSLQPTALASRA